MGAKKIRPFFGVVLAGVGPGGRRRWAGGGRRGGAGVALEYGRVPFGGDHVGGGGGGAVGAGGWRGPPGAAAPRARGGAEDQGFAAAAAGVGAVEPPAGPAAGAPAPGPARGGAPPRRRCTHCASEETPQWRQGPKGPSTLCNACGVRFKSGRLFPEYRPILSPTFSPLLHSNSHRRVMEMRRHVEVETATAGGSAGARARRAERAAARAAAAAKGK
ncbi:unnamed protein product [Miscanthus lutarioriparius]|uniref:GATA-type domain-containing protein n=1 Tax=Miscanthus lutarioriparius TaxID=422564 RepID=A0A811MM52_9POAL|nr:unnamed protein product [Miscanthus lutarioriparius]